VSTSSPPDGEAPIEPLVVHYLGAADEVWLAALLELCVQFRGRQMLELRERLQHPLPVRAPRAKQRVAVRVLERLLPEPAPKQPSPREVRRRLFGVAAHSARFERSLVMAQVAAELGTEPHQLEAALFSDLAAQRRVGALPPELTPHELALRANQARVLALLKRAMRVQIRAWGTPEQLARQAQALGLICRVSEPPPSARDLDALRCLVFDISGPFALFRKTEVYGRALSSLLPRAARCRHFELEADCALGRGPQLSRLCLSPFDPIFPACIVKDGPSVAARLARDFARMRDCEWELSRDPPPLMVDGSLTFPDFELIHRREPARRFWLEVLGFWTPDHVQRKLLARPDPRVILALDERRRCSDAEMPAERQVLRYQGRIDPLALLELLRQTEPEPRST
jgi:predicted nuclease of restriction endonuclease-like RecB superfamily